MFRFDNQIVVLACSAALAVGITGCASSVKYGDAGAVETTTARFGSSDLQQIASKMVDSLLTFPPIVEITASRRPVMFVDTVKNKTSEHIDTESVTDTISSRLLRSGKFRFIDMSKIAALEKQLEYQRESGNVTDETAVKRGQQIGAELMMYGNLSSIVKRADGEKDVYYKFSLKVMNVETGIVEWADEAEIRKTEKKSLLGI